MSFNLLDSVKSLFSNELVNKVASDLGESEGGVQKGLSGSVPAVLVSLLGKAGSVNGASDILNLSKETASSEVLGNFRNFFGDNPNSLLEKGTDMLKRLFGDKLSGIIKGISTDANIKQSSVSFLMSLVAPAALGTLGKHAIENNLNAGGLMNFLASQKNSIISALPSGLNSLLGFGSIGDTISSKISEIQTTTTIVNPKAETKKSSNGSKFVLPILLGILLLGLIFFLGKGRNRNKQLEAATVITDTNAAKNDTATRPIGPESIKVKLPNGIELDAHKGGIEDKLVAFLETDFTKLGSESLKKIWFDFDNLNFKTGSAELTTESQKQVANIAAILKAFPAVKLKIGGYTDKTGNEQNNKKLSAARAKAVKAALDKEGAGSQVTDAEGYGSALARYPAEAPESDRIKDRHVSVSVRL